MAKNRRYSKHRYAKSIGGRASSPKSNPAAVAAAVLFSVLVAALCGRTLDSRYRAALAAVDGQNNEDRAAMRSDADPSAARGGDAAALLERLSGRSGGGILSREEWRADDALAIGDRDVSYLFGQRFTYAPSQAPDFRMSRVTCRMASPAQMTFMEVSFGEDRNGAYVARAERRTDDALVVSVLRRLPSGAEVSLSSKRLDAIPREVSLEVTADSGAARITVGNEMVGSVTAADVDRGIVTFAANMTAADFKGIEITPRGGSENGEAGQ